MTPPDSEALIGILAVLFLTFLAVAYGQWILAALGVIVLVIIVLAMI